MATKARGIDLPGAARSVRPRDSRNRGRVRRRGAGPAEVGDLDQHVGYMLRRAQLAVFADFIATQRGAVARPGQFSVLSVIGRNPGITQSQLCAALGIKRANLVAVIDHLEELDLARREPSKTDRRSNRLRLTDAGQRTLQIALDDQAEHEARIMNLLGTAGKQALLKQLAKLCELGGLGSVRAASRSTANLAGTVR
ncbi:MAG TPA: MarR family transcriptional regulator [Steroidobacteraceae bacterium]|nr:MarR family transcriptional regulator [Steroidobacteraceae bacterium]